MLICLCEGNYEDDNQSVIGKKRVGMCVHVGSVFGLCFGVVKDMYLLSILCVKCVYNVMLIVINYGWLNNNLLAKLTYERCD